MACLQNGATLLNNNNLNAFKHNIMKYNESRSNSNEVWNNTSPINTFFTMNCQIPFRSSHNTKDNIFSETAFKEDEETTNKCREAANTESLVDQTPDSDTDLVTEIRTRNNCQNQGMSSLLLEPDTEMSGGPTPDDTSWQLHDKMSDFELENNNKGDASMKHTDGALEHDSNEPSHHARRPMNAFLIFCKRHRTVVKNKYPHLENRAVTKILGEWWAGLESHEKASYTELAQQYKNAFFSANPNFKWYKLPAPPLRTLNTRPTNITKPPSPKPIVEPEEKQSLQQLFTPGKLADETQLGSITSLIQSDMQYVNKGAQPKINDTAERLIPATAFPKHEYKEYLLSPPCSTLANNQPPKPFKKRMLYQHNDNKSIVRSIFNPNQPEKESKRSDTFDSSLLEQALENFVENVDKEGEVNAVSPSKPNNSNLTQQELINKVVDHMCSADESPDMKNGHDCDACEDANQKEPRKSYRSCKGLRYAKFMAEGKLFVNKRTKKRMSNTKMGKSLYVTTNTNEKIPRAMETIELNETIKKLAERTLGTKNLSVMNQLSDDTDEHDEAEMCRQLAISQRDEHMGKFFRAADFNLDEKIEALPSLSLEKFQQKKKENKKKKFLRGGKMKESASGTGTSRNGKNLIGKDDAVTGSRKRKPRKQSITRLDPQPDKGTEPTPPDAAEPDLGALATLAEVAAKKAKLDQM